MTDLTQPPRFKECQFGLRDAEQGFFEELSSYLLACGKVCQPLKMLYFKGYNILAG